jgi:hypothetical protein
MLDEHELRFAHFTDEKSELVKMQIVRTSPDLSRKIVTAAFAGSTTKTILMY